MKRNTKVNNRKTQKGITLIALVITIIVLLILAGVAINLAIDANGLFSRANEAVTKWNNRVAEEEKIMQNILEQANEINGGGSSGGDEEETDPTPETTGIKIIREPEKDWAQVVTVSFVQEKPELQDQEIMYSFDGTSWNKYSADESIEVTKNNTTVRAKMANSDEEVTATIINIDTVKPSEVTINEVEIYYDADFNLMMSASVDFADGEGGDLSGKSGIQKLEYYYSLDGGVTYELLESIVLDDPIDQDSVSNRFFLRRLVRTYGCLFVHLFSR